MDTGLQAFAEYVAAAEYARISSYAVTQLKIRLLDTLGLALAARDAEPMRERRAQLASAAGASATLIGGGQAAAGQAAGCNAALAEYLDFHDVYLTPAGALHPSPAIPAVLAAAEIADASGAGLLTALAVQYAAFVQLCDRLPPAADAKACAGPALCSAAAAAAKALGLDAARIATAIRLAAADTGGAEPGAIAEGAVRAALRAAQAADPAAAPAAHADAGPDCSVVDWAHADLEGVRATSVRQYAADLHAQAPVDLAVSVSARPLFEPEFAHAVRVKVNQVAFERLGGGDGTDRYQVRTAAQARRSLPWAVAVALLDRALGRAQYAAARLARGDVQTLLRKVSIIPHAPFTARYPAEMRAQIEIEREDGIVNCTSTSSFRGFTLQPLTLLQAAEKFARLAFATTGGPLGEQIIRCVRELDSRKARDLTALLARVPRRISEPLGEPATVGG